MHRRKGAKRRRQRGVEEAGKRQKTKGNQTKGLQTSTIQVFGPGCCCGLPRATGCPPPFRPLCVDGPGSLGTRRRPWSAGQGPRRNSRRPSTEIPSSKLLILEAKAFTRCAHSLGEGARELGRSGAQDSARHVHRVAPRPREGRDVRGLPRDRR